MPPQKLLPIFYLGKICRSSVCNYSNICGGDEPPFNCGPPCPGNHNPSTPTMYDCRKYGHCLPSNDVTPAFDPLPNIPTGVFRCTSGEILGRGASKCSFYRNPEYFSFHHMTYYDFHLYLRGCRRASPKTGRKP